MPGYFSATIQWNNGNFVVSMNLVLELGEFFPAAKALQHRSLDLFMISAKNKEMVNYFLLRVK